MDQKPHNPGLSPKAWKQLHRFIAKMSIKYGDKLNEPHKKDPTNDK